MDEDNSTNTTANNFTTTTTAATNISANSGPADMNHFTRVDSNKLWMCGSPERQPTTPTPALPNGWIEERVKVDRKKFEQMINGECPDVGCAEDFFKRIMAETRTEVSWPPKLKVGTKSKKDPHIRIIGAAADIVSAKEKILASLDSRRNRVTLKMDVAFTDHSHIIGKGGRSIQKVMDETGCHIHFPDSNRTNTVEKSNQVSIAGTAQGAEQARCRIRELLPLTFLFDIPANALQAHALDSTSPTIQSIQQTYGLTINMRFSGKATYNEFGGINNGSAIVTISVRGTRSHILGLRQGFLVLLEYLLGTGVNVSNLPLTLNIDIAAQHHSFVMGRGNCNIRAIMQQTGAVISFPDPAATETSISTLCGSLNSRKSTVTIKGPSFDCVFVAWQELLGYLPLVLIFDLREGQELDAAQITQLMDQLKLSILIKPKQKQNLKSIMVRGAEKDSRLLFEVRKQILDLDETEVPVCCDQHAWLLASKLIASMFLPYCGYPAVQPIRQVTPALNPLAVATFQNGMSEGGFGIPSQLFLQAMMNQQLGAQNNVNQCGQPSVDMLKHFFSGATPSVTSSSSGATSPDDKLSPTNKTGFSTNKNVSSTSFGWPDSRRIDYEERRFLANKALRAKPNSNEARTPTSAWSGLGFSKSMPSATLKNKLLADWTASTSQEPRESSDVPLQTSFWDSKCSLLENRSISKEDSECEKPSNPFSQSNYFDNVSCLKSIIPSSFVDDGSLNQALSQLDLDPSIILSHLGLSKYMDIFQHHEIDFKTFLTLNDADLQELGIAYFGRRKLLSAITDLKRVFKLEQESTSPTNHFEAAPGAERSRKTKTNT